MQASPAVNSSPDHRCPLHHSHYDARMGIHPRPDWHSIPTGEFGAEVTVRSRPSSQARDSGSLEHIHPNHTVGQIGSGQHYSPQSSSPYLDHEPLELSSSHFVCTNQIVQALWNFSPALGLYDASFMSDDTTTHSPVGSLLRSHGMGHHLDALPPAIQLYPEYDHANMIADAGKMDSLMGSRRAQSHPVAHRSVKKLHGLRVTQEGENHEHTRGESNRLSKVDGLRRTHRAKLETCLFCNTVLTGKRNLTRHENSSCPDPDLKSKRKMRKCNKCGYTTARLDNFKRHLNDSRKKCGRTPS